MEIVFFAFSSFFYTFNYRVGFASLNFALKLRGCTLKGFLKYWSLEKVDIFHVSCPCFSGGISRHGPVWSLLHDHQPSGAVMHSFNKLFLNAHLDVHRVVVTTAGTATRSVGLVQIVWVGYYIFRVSYLPLFGGTTVVFETAFQEIVFLWFAGTGNGGIILNLSTVSEVLHYSFLRLLVCEFPLFNFGITDHIWLVVRVIVSWNSTPVIASSLLILITP